MLPNRRVRVNRTNSAIDEGIEYIKLLHAYDTSVMDLETLRTEYKVLKTQLHRMRVSRDHYKGEYKRASAKIIKDDDSSRESCLGNTVGSDSKIKVTRRDTEQTDGFMTYSVTERVDCDGESMDIHIDIDCPVGLTLYVEQIRAIADLIVQPEQTVEDKCLQSLCIEWECIHDDYYIVNVTN